MISKISITDRAVVLKEYDGIVLKSKLEAKSFFKGAREKVLKDINSKKNVLDQQIDEEIKKAEKERLKKEQLKKEGKYLTKNQRKKTQQN